MSIVTEETAKDPSRFAEVKDPTLLNRVPQSYAKTKNCKVTGAEVGVCANVVIRILKNQGIPLGNDAAKARTRYCGCGVRIRTEHDQCLKCRRGDGQADHRVEWVRRGLIHVPVSVFDPEPDGPARLVQREIAA